MGIYTSALLLEHLFTGCFKIIVKLAFHVKVIRISRIIREKRILTPFHISNMGYGSSHDFVTPCFSRFPRLKTRSRVYSPESWTTWRILYQVSIKKKDLIFDYYATLWTGCSRKIVVFLRLDGRGLRKEIDCINGRLLKRMLEE